MSSENFHSPNPELQARLGLLRAAAEGRLDGLPCPQCKEAAVSVWFTQSFPGDYRTWFLCEKCGFQLRAQNSGRPPHYADDRDRTAAVPAEAPGLVAGEPRS